MWDSEYTYSPGLCPGQIIPLGLFLPHPPKNRHSLGPSGSLVSSLDREDRGALSLGVCGLFGSDLGNSPIGAVVSSF